MRDARLQNNLVQHPTEVRLLVQLQDVRILIFGVLAPPRSVFINEKAFRLCHPPKLAQTGGETIVDDDGHEAGKRPKTAKSENKHPRRNSDMPDLHTANTLSGRTRSYSVAEPTSRTNPQPWNMTTAQVFAPLSASSRLNSSSQLLSQGSTADEGIATSSQTGSSSRNRSGSGSALTRMLRLGSSSSSSNNAGPSTRPSTNSDALARSDTNGASTPGSGSRSRNWLRRIGSRDSQEGRSSDDQPRNNGAGLEEVPEDALRGDVWHDLPGTTTTTAMDEREDEITLSNKRQSTIRTHVTDSGVDSLPYSIMTHPCPAPSHALYPNYTPAGQVAELIEKTYPLDPIFTKTDRTTEYRTRDRAAEFHGTDTRQGHPILEERKWLQGVVKDGGSVVPSEWAGEWQAKTWVGPVL